MCDTDMWGREKSSGVGDKKYHPLLFLCLPSGCLYTYMAYVLAGLVYLKAFILFLSSLFFSSILSYNTICYLFQAFPTLESSSWPSTRLTTRPRPSGRCAGSSRCTWWWPSPRWTRRSAGHSGPWMLGPRSSLTGPPG